jgi:hypothetical protein
MVVRAQATQVVGSTEPTTVLELATAFSGDHRVTLGGDTGNDMAAFLVGCLALSITAHVAQNTNALLGSTIDGRTIRHSGYAVS